MLHLLEEYRMSHHSASRLPRVLCVALATLFAFNAPSALAAWEPTKPVELVVPAGTGGGADQMARLLQGVITKNNLMKQPLIVVNKAGGAGAEGFLAVKDAKGDPNKLIITLSNLFTTPMATGVPFNWKDLTPVAMLALDQFVLWVNADTPYKTTKDYIAAVKAGNPTKIMGGTGSKQEDQIITVAIEKAAGVKFTYVPFKGGGDVAVQLVGKHIDSSVNNPIEAGGAVAGRAAASAVRIRRHAHAVQDESHRHDVVERYPELQGSRIGDRLPDAARDLHARRRDAGAGRLLRRLVQEGARNAGVEEIHGGRRLQPDVHDRGRLRQVGRTNRKHPPRTDEGSRVPRQALALRPKDRAATPRGLAIGTRQSPQRLP
jgi:tripartite-type tricarboxylate transporter receptor subunit TctC